MRQTVVCFFSWNGLLLFQYRHQLPGEKTMQDQYKDYSKRWKKCWSAAPDIYLLLRESRSLDSARHKVMNYLNSSESAFRNDYFELSTGLDGDTLQNERA